MTEFKAASQNFLLRPTQRGVKRIHCFIPRGMNKNEFKAFIRTCDYVVEQMHVNRLSAGTNT